MRYSTARSSAYLLPLLVLPDQIDFVSHTSSNALQLELLNKIQQYSSESDEVIDNAGGGLFRNHASYWFHHGEFHRELYRKQFRTKLLREYRASRARFWIKDFRSKRLPARAREYLERHYVRMDGDLHVLGFRIPAYSPERSVLEIDVVSEAEYFLFPADVRQGRGDRTRATGIWLDGSQVRSNSVRLTEGLHSVQLEPGSRDSLLSILPPEAFSSRAHELDWSRLHHSRLFEYSSAN